MIELNEWDSFYLIVGSAAGALIGLQFVVMTLLASVGNASRSSKVGATFATPTIIHFSVALFLAAVIRAPWKSATPIAVILGAIGILGLVYVLVTAWRINRQNAYKPVFEDWLFHAILPLTAYGALASAMFLAFSHLETGLFFAGFATLLMLFIGIHNAWDTATWHMFYRGSAGNDKSDEESEEDKEDKKED
jgi:hypothetical protein